MTLALYVKSPPNIPGVKNKKKERAFSVFISTVGILAILFAVFPFVVWQVKTLPKLSGVGEAPVPTSQVLSSSTIASEVKVVEDPDGFSYFVPISQERNNEISSVSDESRPAEFFITIPKLKIENARVKVDSLKFDNNLALFPNSALPGQTGNAFITGHSVLPQFNDPKNYRAIFTKLSDLEVGDSIQIDMDGATFNYVVQYAKIVDPHDVSVLAPISQNAKNLTLMTCVPPGTNIKRLVVITSLI